MWQFYGPVVSAARNRRAGQNIALGQSRAPLDYQPIELPCYKAAPLQTFGPLDTQRVCNPSVFLSHPPSALAFLSY